MCTTSSKKISFKPVAYVSEENFMNLSVTSQNVLFVTVLLRQKAKTNNGNINMFR